MDWEAIGAVGEIIGAIAVVVTLGFLTLQMRQSNKLAEGESERDWFLTWQEAVRALGESEEVAQTIKAGFANYHSLSDPKKVVFHTRLASVLDTAYLGVTLNVKGLLSEDISAGALRACLGVIKTQGGAQWWDEMSQTFVYKRLFESKLAAEPDIKAIDELSVWRLDGSPG